jgi:hypothetical protein
MLGVKRIEAKDGRHQLKIRDSRVEAFVPAEEEARTSPNEEDAKCWQDGWRSGSAAYFVFKFIRTQTIITAKMPNIVTAVGSPRSAHLVSHAPLNWKYPISHSEH